jgi:tetratricopeptide (TPR) repeat protein
MRKATWILILASAGTFTACSHLQLALHPDGLTAEEHVTLGQSYAAKGENDLALREYQVAYDQNPHFYPALMALGETAYERKQWSKARSYFKKALKAIPDDPGAINNLAMVDLAEGKHLARARKNLEHALPTSGALKPYLEDTLASIKNLQT